MRIGIDARFYGPVGKGLGRYTQKLVEHLETVADEHEFVVFLRKENFDLFQPTSPRFRKVLADFRWYTLAEQLRFPGLIRREGIDLMHFPHFNIPVLVPCPFVVTIHDLILLRFPTKRATTLNALTYRIKYAAYRHVIRTAVRKAKRIITVSEFTKRDIMERFGTDASRVAVTYEAADPAPETFRDADLASKGVVKPYFLYVGNAYPHKNLEALLETFAGLRKDGLDAQLVLVGKEDYFYERLRTEAESLGLLGDDSVIFWGYAEDEDLPSLYRGARAYVFPSHFEGFGLPPLEAMRFGTPVVSSDASCLPEILGDAARFFDPKDSGSMATAMKDIFIDAELRSSLAERGKARAMKFDWGACAAATYDIYRHALDE